MKRTNRLPIFTSQAIAKNASVVSVPHYLGKCGPLTTFHYDLGISGAGMVEMVYQVGNTASSDFYTPTSAVTMTASHDAGSGTNGQDRAEVTIMSTEWIKFKLKERNASNVVASLNLLISQDN